MSSRLLKLISKSEIQSLVSINLSRSLIKLILDPFLLRHLAPNILLLLIQIHEPLALRENGDNSKRKDRDADGVAGFVVWAVPAAVNLVANDGAPGIDG